MISEIFTCPTGCVDKDKVSIDNIRETMKVEQASETMKRDEKNAQWGRCCGRIYQEKEDRMTKRKQDGWMKRMGLVAGRAMWKEDC